MTDIKNQVYRDTTAVKEQQLRQDPLITPENRQILAEFIQSTASRGIERTTKESHYIMFKRLGKLTTTPLSKFTKKDAEELMAKLESTNREDTGAPLMTGTKNITISAFKMLMKYLDIPPSVYSWIKKRKTVSKLQSENLLSNEEISSLVVSAPTLMHRALISTLAETGARPGEVLQLTIGNVIVNHDHIKMYVAGKTQKHTGNRPIFVFKSYAILKEWLAAHPDKKNQNAPVFTRHEGKPINVHVFSTWFKYYAQNLIPNKKVNAYLLRHTFATTCVRKGFAPAVIKKLLGHSNLQMQETYQHLSETDSEIALRQDAGLIDASIKTAVDADKCLRCNTLNGYGCLICSNCHSALNAAGAIRIETEAQQQNSKWQRMTTMLERLEKTELGTRFLKLVEDAEAAAATINPPQK